MSLRIQLDGPGTTYTNLDFISGRVILYLASPTTFSSIVAKLEGESRTRLQGFKQSHHDSQQAKPTTEMEYHRLLYKTQTVFPPPELQRQGSSNPSYTLTPGQYEYPFKFKLPFNNTCWNNNYTPLSNVSFAGMKLDVVRDTNRHTKKTLPPSLLGFPGLCEIKYFIKVTAAKPKFYQENLRAYHDIRFVPIEPPRSENPRGEEVFARRNNKFAQAPRPMPKKISLRKASSKNAGQDVDLDPPAFTVDARLPNPAILTCNETVPLRVLVQKTNQSSEILFLSTLSIELFAFTNIRAHELTRTEAGSWILTSQANMQAPLGSTNDYPGREYKIPKRYFDQIRLPTAICPSFETCNVSRSYELEVRVGLSHGLVGNVKPELVMLPLRFPIQVYSGIAPPPELLQAMAGDAIPSQRPSLAVPHQTSYQPEPSPIGSPYPAPEYPPAQTGSFAPNTSQPPYDDAPPTYEEALAADIGPLDGPRHNYEPPASPAPPPRSPRLGTSSNEKGGVHRKPSERLFSQGDEGSSSSGPSNGVRQSSFSQASGVASQQTQNGVSGPTDGTPHGKIS